MRFYAPLAAAVLALLPLAAVCQTTPVPAKSSHAPVQKSAPPQVVAQTPPMGWNSWNFFGHKVTDQDIRNAADQIVSTGMKDAGYVYVNIDDTWEGDRDANGVLHANSKFPDMKALADYVHSKGLKLGIYSSPGPQTCARFAASRKVLNVPFRLTATWRSNEASSLSAIVARVMIPALLISTSTPPNAVSAESNMRATAPALEMSARAATAWPPAPSILRTSASAGTGFPA